MGTGAGSHGRLPRQGRRDAGAVVGKATGVAGRRNAPRFSALPEFPPCPASGCRCPCGLRGRLEAVRQYGPALAFVPKERKTPEVCLEAVKQDGRALRWVPARMKTEELCIEAVRQCARALKFVPERLKTPAVCLEAVSQRGLSLEDVPVPMRTEEMCLAAVRQHACAMQYVPVRHRDAVRTALAQETELDAEPEDTEPETDNGPRP